MELPRQFNHINQWNAGTGIGHPVCAGCQSEVREDPPVLALGNHYHRNCFRCVACHGIIDPTGPFSYIEDDQQRQQEAQTQQQPIHQQCYFEIHAITCTVCRQTIPVGPDGGIRYDTHPFFRDERMCRAHTTDGTRRCTSCHRFEPNPAPFANLEDANRCICWACLRSIVVDSRDIQPLWTQVVLFFEQTLGLDIPEGFRDIPILVAGYDGLNTEINRVSNVHGSASQFTTRGLCLTEHETRDGWVTAILCLSGLPRDLSASVLAHEATHAWIKLHPDFDVLHPIPSLVEEGCAQLIARLFLDELDENGDNNNNNNNNNNAEYNQDGTGPTNRKLRQYYKFSIDTDDDEIYGVGYQLAKMAYEHIGIEVLLDHVISHRNFPET